MAYTVAKVDRIRNNMFINAHFNKNWRLGKACINEGQWWANLKSLPVVDNCIT